jgi:hypothetical protein
MSNQFNLACPECGSTDELDIAATVWVRLTADGTDADESHDGSHEWGDSSACHCNQCGWDGTAGQADADCAEGTHSWIDETGLLPPDTACTRCGALYGHPD